ncbi:RCH2 [Symbiodinium necroappetens]|uniref:RCH2 protein n=1 Tax=Symbiodinium necroappetens TaxID=1628268 RepID=A0A812T5L2_9DINO|nr:RCH2 [Symbiodinium necroappetens]
MLVSDRVSVAHIFDSFARNAGKERLPDTYAFRSALPDIKCQDAAPLADSIAASCIVCYGLLIPSFLAYLMFKQHLALAPSRCFVSHVAKKEGEVTVWVLPVEESEKPEPEQDKELKRKSLLAAAVARSCIYFAGGVRVQLQDERLILRPQEQSGQEHDASSFVWTALGNKGDADLRRCQALERMLKERYVLDEVASSDRIVAGAKELFVKYAMRIVAVALVAAVRSENGLEFTLGYTLCTSLAIATIRASARGGIGRLMFCLLLGHLELICQRLAELLLLLLPGFRFISQKGTRESRSAGSAPKRLRVDITRLGEAPAVEASAADTIVPRSGRRGLRLLDRRGQGPSCVRMFPQWQRPSADGTRCPARALRDGGGAGAEARRRSRGSKRFTRDLYNGAVLLGKL